MGRFIIKRLFIGLITWFILIGLVFFGLRILPGGPFLAEERLSQQAIDNLNSYYQLNKPLFIQFKTYLLQVLNVNLGPSYYFSGQNVEDIISTPLFTSMTLGLVTMILSLLVAIILTYFLYIKREFSNLFKINHLIVISLPLFLIAPLLQFLFSVYLKWTPIRYNQTYLSLLLPILILSLKPIYNFTKILNNQINELYNSQFLIFAKAKGLSSTQIFFKHILKNIFISCLSHFTFYFIYLISGVFIVEHIFSIPGISSYFITSIQERDYPIILSIILIYGSLFILMNILADIVIKKLDPRIDTL